MPLLADSSSLCHSQQSNIQGRILRSLIPRPRAVEAELEVENRSVENGQLKIIP
jgi:hypothetical protein